VKDWLFYYLCQIFVLHAGVLYKISAIEFENINSFYLEKPFGRCSKYYR